MALPFPTSSPPTRAGALRRPLPRSSTDMPARTKSKETRVSFPTTPDLDDGEGSPPRQREPSAASLPRLLARSRRVSLPANLVQTHSHSLAGTGGSYFGASPYSADNRMSVASFASMSSFDSLPEEDEEATTPDAGERRDAPPTARPPLLRRSVSPSRPSPLPRPVSFAPQGSARSNNPKRNSLPTPPAFDGSYRPFSLGPMPLSRSSSRGRTSPLGRDDRDEELGEKGKRSEGEREQERAKREERRWKIAEELRETERAYVDVLEEIDAHYYQPLLAALPPVDPLHRRTSTRSSYPSAPTSPVLRPSISPTSTMGEASRSRTSTVESTHSSSSTTTATSTTASTSASSVGPVPILAGKSIAEIFSNFSDVLNLSHVMLLALDEAVPDRPSKPLPLSPMSSLARLPSLSPPTSNSGSPEPELCSSGGTEDSDGVHTPLEGDLSSSQEEEARRRALSSTSRKERRAHAPPLTVGKSLLPILPFLKQYSLFISNFSASLSRLSALEAGGGEEGARWQAFCEDRRRSGAGRNLGLGGMLLGIVQRVPRYRLMLGDLVKYTERDHPDMKELMRAWETVDKVATHLEAQIRSHTSDLQLLDLQRSFTNLDSPLLAPGRRLLKSGHLRKLDRRGAEQTRSFFLFNDMLIHASGGEVGGWLSGGSGALAGADGGRSHGGTPVGSGSLAQAQYRLHRRLALEDLTVVGEDSTSEREPGRQHGFQILSSEKSFAVYAATHDDKIAWVDAIRDTKADLLRDRRTLQLQRVGSANVSQQPQRANTTPRRERRISLPAFATSSATHLLAPAPNFSLPTPMLGVIPATPIDEPSMFLIDSRASIGAPSSGEDPTSPLELEGRETAFIGGESEVAGLREREYRVISLEDYSAPVWVPDSKAERCMRCSEGFSVWRRRHHCRLCGGVVCWRCSENFFIIPSPATEPNGPDRLARACDPCYHDVFGADSRSSSPTEQRALHPSPAADILSPPSSPPAFHTSPGDFVYRALEGKEGDVPAFCLSPVEGAEAELEKRRRVVSGPATPGRERRTAMGALEAVLKPSRG